MDAKERRRLSLEHFDALLAKRATPAAPTPAPTIEEPAIIDEPDASATEALTVEPAPDLARRWARSGPVAKPATRPAPGAPSEPAAAAAPRIPTTPPTVRAPWLKSRRGPL
jgi:hypothetical protein